MWKSLGKFDVVIKWEFDDSILVSKNIVDIVKYALGSESTDKVVEDYVRHKVQKIIEYADSISDFKVVDANLHKNNKDDHRTLVIQEQSDDGPEEIDGPEETHCKGEEKNSELKPVFQSDLTKEEIEANMVNEYFNLVSSGAKVESVIVNNQELYNYALYNVVPTEEILSLDEEALYNVKFSYKNNNKIGELII